MISSARALSDALSALAQPAATLLDPSTRVFAPFLFVAGVIAVATLAARGVGVGRAARGIFSRTSGCTPRPSRTTASSPRGRCCARSPSAACAACRCSPWRPSLMAWLRLNLGLAGPRGLPLLAVGALFTLTAFVAEDLARFLAHRAMHRVPALWAFHRVHHCAEVLTPLTLYRTHPVEGALNGAAGALAVGLVTGVLAWVFGPSLRAWQLLGVDALGLLWVLSGANLRHSHVWLSYGPRVERWLLSPAQHQVHHSRDAAHADKNLGTALAVWDRLGGSLYVTHHHERLRFGLPEAEAPMPHTVPSMLLSPFATIFAQARRASVAPRAALLAAALLTATCSNEQRFDRASLLQGIARCTMQVNDQFHTAAGTLATATAAYATTPGDTQRRRAAPPGSGHRRLAARRDASLRPGGGLRRARRGRTSASRSTPGPT